MICSETRRSTLQVPAVSSRVLRQSAKRDGIGPVSLGNATLGDHLIADGEARGVAVVRILALVEDAVDRHAAGGTRTRNGVRQVHLEHFARLDSPRAR